MDLGARFETTFSQISFEKFKTSILSRAFGNYTKHYELFKRIKNIEGFFKEAIKEQKISHVLDVGCGDGYHICVFNGIDGVKDKVVFKGVDISEVKVEFISRVAKDLSFDNMGFEVGSAEALGFEDATFDVVLCNDVVEHLKYPEKCFEEILRVLKPGGAAIITTPNADSIAKRMGERIRPRDTKRGFEEGGHISLKGRKEWVKISDRTGFEVLAVRRGALIFGGHKWNRRPILFAFIILIDRMLDFVPFANNWGEAITMKLRKPPTSRPYDKT